MTCAEFEVALCDFLDGVLRGDEKAAFEGHMASCSGCAAFAREVGAAVSFVERAALVEPPAELLTRILHDAPSGRSSSGAAPARTWTRRIFGGVFDSVLQPRYAMGMAMTLVSLSMLARFTGIETRQITPADLNPVKIWAGVDDRAHRIWDRAVQHYDNLRLVIEVQSRLKDFSDQEAASQGDAAKEKSKAK